MCVHLCNCQLYGWILLVSVNFKTSGRCLLKGGKYVAHMKTSHHFRLGANLDLSNCRLPYREVTLNLTLWWPN